MFMRRIVLGGLMLVGLAFVGFGAWVFSLPMPAVVEAAPVPGGEMDAMLAALKPPDKSSRRKRPLIAVVGLNDATETTDYLMSAGILRRADVADVVMLATGPGPVRLYPALAVEADATTAEFDAHHPEGADYVIVPAMSRDDDPVVLAWLRDQHAKGAIIIAVCAGAKVVAAAGLLDGKRATTHWYYLKEMLKRSPSIIYVPDRRMVTDGRVTTTTGISASTPMMLTLIEAVAGRVKAEAVARGLGLPDWDARHASGAFRITRPFALTVLGNRLAFWNREKLEIRLVPGVDEVSLALTADAWSRTYRSHAVTFGASPVETRSGIRILPDRSAQASSNGSLALTIDDHPPAQVLDATLAAISDRYGAPTARVVAIQLEYATAGAGD